MNYGLVGIVVNLKSARSVINNQAEIKMKKIHFILVFALSQISVWGKEATYSLKLGGFNYSIEINKENKPKTRWDTTSDLPVSTSDIIKASRKHLIDSKVKIDLFVLASIKLVSISGLAGHWYYVVTFESDPPPVKAPPTTLVVVLLLDGSVVPGRKDD